MVGGAFLSDWLSYYLTHFAQCHQGTTTEANHMDPSKV